MSLGLMSTRLKVFSLMFIFRQITCLLKVRQFMCLPPILSSFVNSACSDFQSAIFLSFVLSHSSQLLIGPWNILRFACLILRFDSGKDIHSGTVSSMRTNTSNQFLLPLRKVRLYFGIILAARDISLLTKSSNIMDLTLFR